jgi:hypothetical protein
MATEKQIAANRRNAQFAGRPKLFATKLREALIRLAEEEAEPLARVLMDKAKSGDVPAIKEMLDRGLGKAVQAVDVTSKGESVRFELTPKIAAAAVAMDEAVKEEMYGSDGKI